MTWYDKVIALHTAVTDAVSHVQRMKSDRYFVWQEDGANDFLADERHAEKCVTGSTDLFTRQEFDPWKDAFEQSLDAAPVWPGPTTLSSMRRTPVFTTTNGFGR